MLDFIICIYICSTDTHALDEDTSAIVAALSPVKLNTTLQNLRNKKVKVPQESGEEINRRCEILQSKINCIVRDGRKSKESSRFISKAGRICVQPITQVVDDDILKHFSKKEIRDIIVAALNSDCN